MGNKKNVPAIRFKGFAEEWKEEIMAKIGNPYNGLSGKNRDDFGHGDAKFITYMNVFSNPIADLCQTDRVEIDNKQHSVQYGDVLFTVSSETPEEVGMSSVWLGRENNIYLNSFCFGYRLNTYKDPYYIAYLLRAKSTRKKIAFLAQGISRYNISKNRVMEIELPFPDLGEQKVLGKYFQNIDRLINTSQTKLDKLKNIKKACLEKMFTRNSSNTPELRFKGFTEGWKEIAIEDIASDFYGGGTPRTSIERYWNGNIPWIQTSDLKEDVVFGVVPQKFISNSGVKESATKLVPENSIAVITRVGVGKLALIPFKYATSQDFLSISKLKVDEYFAAYIMHRKMQTVLKEVQGTSIKGVTKEELLAKKIEIPTKKDEQKAIGRFFKNLDDLITKTEQQINKLKNIKKACLDKMFVNRED